MGNVVDLETASSATLAERWNSVGLAFLHPDDLTNSSDWFYNRLQSGLKRPNRIDHTPVKGIAERGPSPAIAISDPMKRMWNGTGLVSMDPDLF